MDGMTTHPWSIGASLAASQSFTDLQAPQATIAQISLTSFNDFASNPNTDNAQVIAAFTYLEYVDDTGQTRSRDLVGEGGIPEIAIQNGMTRIDGYLYAFDCSAFGIVNYFYWPAVASG